MELFKRIMGGRQEEAGDRSGGLEPRHVTAAEFDTDILGAELPAVVDFWAEWCGPCHAIAPAVKELAQEFDGRAIVAKLNADDYPDILSRYRILGIPTLIYFKHGQEVDRVVGMTRYGVLKDKLEKLLD